jgi:hypothetical protein
MTPTIPPSFWEGLFPTPAEPGQGVRVTMRLLKKGGRPFLLLPALPRPAAATMDLYPAQTSRARAAGMLLRCLLRLSLPIGTERVSLTVYPEDPFARLLQSLATDTTSQRNSAGNSGSPSLPTLGMLAGNPGSAGQRFLLLVFDGHQRPVAVVKAGLSEQAKALIGQEESFLTAVPANTMAVPRLRASLQLPRLRALALDFFAGDSPRPHQEAALPPLLESWIDPKQRMRVSDAPVWVRLEKACSGDRLFRAIAGSLSGKCFQAALQHGDLAPWNIKVSPTGAWTVLDWERGELAGIPGWDWFHYIIQSAILVGRLPIPVLVQRVEGLLSSAAFQRYAERAGICGCERELLLAYLLNMAEVIKPSEGLAQTCELLRALAGRWRAGDTPAAR